MAVEPIDAGSSRFTWTGEFEPKDLSNDDGIAFTKRVYETGIGLMQRTFAARR